MSSAAVQEITIDYTDCKSDSNPLVTCASQVSDNCTCLIDFTLEKDFRKDIYVYYGLSNFYQNHRRYVKSRDDVQLLGNPKTVSSECYPYDYLREKDKQPIPIAPCGAIANSKFNDTFKITLKNFEGDKSRSIRLSKEGIAWYTDKNIRFRNPSGPDLKAAFEGTAKPPNWRKPVYELASDPNSKGFQNEDLIVWMRTAALPTFRKLYGIVATGAIDLQQEIDYLPAGQYSLHIDYNYPVVTFNGRKRFIMSNTSWLGGKNNFLGIAYVVVGCTCFLISAFFLYIHKKSGRLPSEITHINQSTPYLAT